MLIRLAFLIILFNGYAQEVGFKYTNALINEESAYLREHAHNPVNWQPWDSSALQQAKEQSRLVVISIGYASCHWCQVMAEESFEDEAVAEVMNASFINIKVDREERPDIDQIYMTALQLIKGEGGWPLNVIALPDGRPLYAGTYHSKTQWLQVLTKLSNLYDLQPEKALAFADNLTTGLKQASLVDPPPAEASFSKDEFAAALTKWKSQWDLEYGGNLGDQKFMLPASLSFLLDYAVQADDSEVWQHAERTLDAMASGGIYDHLGGGFFRYATDRSWKIPHFEKMLYDNAQLAGLYAKAYRVFKKPEYKYIAEQTLAFIERELKNAQGTFNSSIRADTDAGEGAYYLWKEEELAETFGAFSKAEAYFNFFKFNDQQFVLGVSEGKTHKELDEPIEKLAELRQLRIRPETDIKIITSWNALLISAYCEAYKAFQDEQYIVNAANLYKFIDKPESLELRHTQNNSHPHVYLEDYAYLIRAALDLYLADGNSFYINRSEAIFDKTKELFHEPELNVFRYAQDQHLISPVYKLDDDVLPSPNLVMASSSWDLGKLTENTEYLTLTTNMLQILKQKSTEHPASYPSALGLQLKYLFPYYEVVIAGPQALVKAKEFWQTPSPNALVVFTENDSDLPLFKNRYEAQETYLYVCQETFCKLPTTEVEEALKQLR